MAMPNAYHGVSAVDVEVFLTLVVPYLASLALYHIYVEKGIYVK